jgi:hypothetical protein
MLITSILIVAIGSALIVTLRTSDSTNGRLRQNHDVQIESAYLANDVQSAADVSPGSGGNCSGAFTTLVTFTYWSTDSPQAVYRCGTAPNGETQVTRTFANGSPIVLAHFAGPARPSVNVTMDQNQQPPVPVSVAMTFTKGSGCTLDCTYTLFGSRRSFNFANANGYTPIVGDVAVLSTGTASPLWVQGSCPDPGTTNSCFVDSSITALPIADLQTSGWSPTPLWSPLSDGDTATGVSNAAGSSAEARVSLSAVSPPDPSFLPFVEFSVTPLAGTQSTKMTVTLYNGASSLASTQIGPINGNPRKNYDWTLTAAQANSIPAAAYANLTLGFSVSSANPGNQQTVLVDGVGFDTASPSGLLNIRGSLVVNSPLSNAVRLTGSKTATKMTITNGGDFKIWNPGACTGCNHTTVTCLGCAWNGQQPWTNYPNSIPDPLRSLAAPPRPAGTTSCSGSVCPPGRYTSFSRTSNTTLTSGPNGTPGIYYLDTGMSITGNASLTCQAPCTGGVLLYIPAGGSVTLAGNGVINLPAAPGGPYKGVVMFQARDNSNPVKVTGNAGTGQTNVFGGIVYVPASTQVTLATGSASLTATAIVAQNIKVSSSVSIG